jgi:murein DD-endopeptidase MepM/ murein hydrolase activator NlpD
MAGGYTLKTNSKRKWTILFISGAGDAVHQIQHSKKAILLLIAIFTSIFLATITASIYYYSKTKELHTQRWQLANIIEKQEEMIVTLNQDKTKLLYKTKNAETKMDELLDLEQQIRDVLEELNPRKIRSTTYTESEDGGLGGLEEVPLEPGKINELTSKDSIDISNDAPELITDFKEILLDMESLKSELSKVPIIWPTNTRKVTSTFGERKDPFTSRTSNHHAIDIGGDYLEPIFATADGMVTEAGYDGAYGRAVMIRHSQLFKTKYAHMARLNVSSGEKVQQGQIIGYMGSTGRSTGVHLHYEIFFKGVRVDPYPYIKFLEKGEK